MVELKVCKLCKLRLRWAIEMMKEQHFDCKTEKHLAEIEGYEHSLFFDEMTKRYGECIVNNLKLAAAGHNIELNVFHNKEGCNKCQSL